jgi:putative component of membrane protein insertase Oxa1/YidC/SpoIIIJ protein YidD
MQAVAVDLIEFYQRRLSPHKGYRCAHRAHHGGMSCSEFAKQTILVQGLMAALPAMKRRFSECRATYLALQSQEAGPLSSPAPTEAPAGGEYKDSHPATKQGDLCANVCTMPCL